MQIISLLLEILRVEDWSLLQLLLKRVNMQLRVLLTISGNILTMIQYLLLSLLLWNILNVDCQKRILLRNLAKMMYKFIIKHLHLQNGNSIMIGNQELVTVRLLYREVLKLLQVFITWVQMQEKLCKAMLLLCNLKLSIKTLLILQEYIQLLLRRQLRISQVKRKMRVLKLVDAEVEPFRPNFIF